MSIVTKTGDKGETGLFGGMRVSKASIRIEAVGAVDELNAVLGMMLAEELSGDMHPRILRTQHLLFRLGADLATPIENNKAQVPRVRAEDAAEVEERIRELESILQPMQSFILPGGTKIASLLHLARTVCRRAERRVVALSKEETVDPACVVYLNRLSDWLFLAARKANFDSNREDTKVEYN